MNFIHQHWQFIKEILAFASGIVPILMLPRSVILKQQESSDLIVEKMKSAEDRYVLKMAEYYSQQNVNDIAAFAEISILGNEYFTQLTILSDRILEGILNTKTVYNTLIPDIENVMNHKMIQRHYEVLEQKSGNKGKFVYDPNRYKSLNEVYLKFISGDKIVDYRLKPLRYAWKKVQCVLVPIACFSAVQLIAFVIDRLFLS